MSFVATFGSVGDFVTICQLAVQLAKAVGDGHGASSTEYQDLRNELDTFAQVLTHVGLVHSALLMPVPTRMTIWTDVLADRGISHAARISLN